MFSIGAIKLEWQCADEQKGGLGAKRERIGKGSGLPGSMLG